MTAPSPSRLRSPAAAAVVGVGVLLAGSGAGVVGGASPAWASTPASEVDPTSEDRTVGVGTEPDGSAVALETSVFVPGGEQPAAGWPSVVLAHGYGGSKADLEGQGEDLARRGYVVATYTARGFGASGGRIHLGSPEFEGADVRAVVGLLEARPDVERDDGGDPADGGDPVVGVAGASYGGSAALLAEGTDPRVDAVAAAITWNDLGASLTPQAATLAGGGEAAPGVLKSAWVGQLLRPSLPPTDADGQPVALAPGSTSQRPGCGRLAENFCSAYLDTLESGGVPTPELSDLLSASSPARVLDGASAPALLVQGEADTLFGLDASLANAEQLRAAGAPVTLAWSTGGHDALGELSKNFRVRTREFFGQHLVPSAERPTDGSADGASDQPAFTYALPLPAVAALAGGGGGGGGGGDGDGDDEDDDADPGGFIAPLRSQDSIPSPRVEDNDASTTALALSGLDGAPDTQPLLFPAGGLPAARTSIPGLGVLSSLPGLAAGAVVPGQSAVFTTEPLERPLSLAGPSSVDLVIAAPTGSAVLFAALYDVDDGGAAVLPGGGVTPLRVDTGAGPTQVSVQLPTVAREILAGHRLRLVVASTDSGYAMPTAPAPYTVALAGDLRVTTAGEDNAAAQPLESATTLPTAQVVVAAVLAGLALVAALVLALRRRTGRHRAAAAAATARAGKDPSDTPSDTDDDVVLSVDHLVLEYRGGVRAVDDASFTVRRGQVVGLLGPNGAGKTTALRVVLGLIRPTEGSVQLLGTPITPGAPVLARVGALVEGTGFLPHLSGRENLELFWRATGRPAADAHLEEALAVADLGDRVERRVGGYSQGMRMRLGIASALLGLPELLVLDEPTNGLDPPQITAMRQVLRDYAATGRTVIVSSHLLAEVEATCSHVVVMAKGRVLAEGSVADLVGTASSVKVDVGPGEAERALAVVDGLAGGVEGLHAAIDSDAPGERVLVTLPATQGAPAADDVVAALVAGGVAVRAVVPQRHLEQVFLELVGEQ